MFSNRKTEIPSSRHEISRDPRRREYSALHRIGHAAERAATRILRTCDDAMISVNQTKRSVRAHPVRSSLLALGVGYMLGSIFGR